MLTIPSDIVNRRMMPGFHARLQNARKLQPNRCTRNFEYVVIRKARAQSFEFTLSF